MMNKHGMDTPFSNLFREIGMKLKGSADARLNELGLNSQQGRMIGYIFENQEKGIIQKDLADQFKRKGASITSMLQGLEKKGYIERVISENDERQKYIYVLEKGALLVEEFNKIFSEVESSITSSLSQEEIDTLQALLLKVKSSL
ncbi:Multiple antibiotic resistance protein MarR [compost metagenome]